MQIGDDEPKRLSKASQHDGSVDLLILIKRSLLSIHLSLKLQTFYFSPLFLRRIVALYPRLCMLLYSKRYSLFERRYLQEEKVFLSGINIKRNKPRNKSCKGEILFYFISLNLIELLISYISIFLVFFIDSISPRISKMRSRRSLRFSRRASPPFPRSVRGTRFQFTDAINFYYSSTLFSPPLHHATVNKFS